MLLTNWKYATLKIFAYKKESVFFVMKYIYPWRLRSAPDRSDKRKKGKNLEPWKLIGFFSFQSHSKKVQKQPIKNIFVKDLYDISTQLKGSDVHT